MLQSSFSISSESEHSHIFKLSSFSVNSMSSILYHWQDSLSHWCFFRLIFSIEVTHERLRSMIQLRLSLFSFYSTLYLIQLSCQLCFNTYTWRLLTCQEASSCSEFWLRLMHDIITLNWVLLLVFDCIVHEWVCLEFYED